MIYSLGLAGWGVVGWPPAGENGAGLDGIGYVGDAIQLVYSILNSRPYSEWDSWDSGTVRNNAIQKSKINPISIYLYIYIDI